MNILYLGHYRENTGLGISSLRFVHGLKQKYENLAIRPLYEFRDKRLHAIEDIEELEKKSFNKYDCVIQHTLPTLLSYDKNMGKNIGVVNIPTINIAQSVVPDYLNLMDEIYVRSTYSYNNIEKLINNKCKVVYEPFDEVVDDTDAKRTGTFKFFATGTLEDRYNLKKIVMAFLSEFSTENLVELILHIDGDVRKSANMVHQVYDRLRIPITNENKVTILNEQKTEKNQKTILKNIDCSIVLDKADDSGIVSIQSLLYNNIVITQDRSASCDFVNEDNGFIVDSYEIGVEDLSNNHDNSIYSIYESYYDADIGSLKTCMRNACTLTSSEKRLKQLNIDKSKFSYKTFINGLP
jgi:hypothetical protein